MLGLDMRFRYPRFTVGFVAASCLMFTINGIAFSQVLKGHLQRQDQPARIKRPALPMLPGQIDGGRTEPSMGSMKTGIQENDFAISFHKMSPQRDDTAYGSTVPKQGAVKENALVGEVESAELVIAWEEWHRRVCAAIFARWRQFGVLPGVAATTLTFTRDRHVQVTIRDVEIDPTIYDVFPAAAHMSAAELQQAFMKTVYDSVQPMEGDLVLEFPERSRRKSVHFNPAFRGTDGPAGYNWKKGDYERVPTQ